MRFCFVHFILLSLLLLSVAETRADNTSATAISPPPSILMRAWQKVSNPWGATSVATNVTPAPSAKLTSSTPAGCACSAQSSYPFASSLANLAHVRDSLYQSIDKAYHWFRPGIVGSEWAKSCNMFIEANGTYGTYGKAMSSTLTPQTHPNLFNNDMSDLTQYCPAFKSWTGPEGIEKKKMFWVWLAASVAQGESSCNQATPPKRGPYGTLKGLFQLHSGHEDDYPINSPASYHCSRNASETATGSGVCFFKMMNFYVGVHHSIFNAPKDPDRYWQTLFTTSGGNKVRERLKYFTPCQLK